MISFENCDVVVNGSGIMAETASLNTQSQVSAIQSLGYLRPFGYTPVGPFQTNLQINYFFEPGNEPIYAYVNTIKSMLTGFINDEPRIVSVAGLTGTYYIDNYSIQSQEHQPLKATVSLISFYPISGIVQTSNQSVNYNLSLSASLGHYYSSVLCIKNVDPITPSKISFNTYETKNIREFNYSIKLNWNPIFSLGNPYPVTVRFNSAEETVSILHDDFSLIAPTGFSPSQTLGVPIDVINRPSFPSEIKSAIIALAYYSDLPIDISVQPSRPFISISDGIVKSNQIANSAGNIAKISTTIIRNY